MIPTSKFREFINVSFAQVVYVEEWEWGRRGKRVRGVREGGKSGKERGEVGVVNVGNKGVRGKLIAKCY